MRRTLGICFVVCCLMAAPAWAEIGYGPVVLDDATVVTAGGFELELDVAYADLGDPAFVGGADTAWFIGVGLGAIGADMVNRPDQFGINVSGLEGIWSVEPSNVATEALAGMGIIGFIIGVWLLVYIAIRLWRISVNSRVSEKYRLISQSLFWSYLLQILILQFNATFLRPYIWFHIGLCIAMVHCMEHYFIKKSSGGNIIAGINNKP